MKKINNTENKRDLRTSWYLLDKEYWRIREEYGNVRTCFMNTNDTVFSIEKKVEERENSTDILDVENKIIYFIIKGTCAIDGFKEASDVVSALRVMDLFCQGLLKQFNKV